MEGFIKESIEYKKRIEIIIDASFYRDKLQNWLKTFDNLSEYCKIKEYIKLVQNKDKCQINKLLLFKNGIRTNQNDISYIKDKVEELTFIENEKLSYTLINYFKEQLYDNIINVNSADVIQINYTINIPIKDSIILCVELIKEIDKNINSHTNYLEYNIQNMFCKNSNYKKFIQSKAWNMSDRVYIHLFPTYDLHNNSSESIIQIIKQITKNISTQFYGNQLLSHKHVVSNLLKQLSDNLKIKKITSYNNFKNSYFKNLCFQDLVYDSVPLNIPDIYDILKNNAEKYIIYSKFKSEKYVVYLNGGNLFLINNVDILSISMESKSILPVTSDRKNINKTDICVIMCANLVKNNNIYDVYVYDILYYNNSPSGVDCEYNNINKILIHKPFSSRYQYINDVIELMNSFKCTLLSDDEHYIDIIFKKITTDYLNNINIPTYNALQNNSSYEGLIIQNISDGNFLSNKSLIWKYKKNIIMHFLIRKTAIVNEYILMVKHKIKGIDSIIPFKPRDFPLIYNYTSFKEQCITEDDVGEFYWTGKKWKLLDINKTSIKMINDFRTAELTWQNRKNYIDINNLFTMQQSICTISINHLFTKYIKSKLNKIIICCNDTILKNNDLYKLAQKTVNRNSRIYLFVEKYIETWMVRNIHDTFNQDIYLMNKLIICPTIFNFIQLFKKNKEKLELKGITLPNNQIEVMIITCFDSQIIIANLASIVIVAKKFLIKYGKLIFVGSICNSIFDTNNITLCQNKKMELEIKTDEFISFIKI